MRRFGLIRVKAWAVCLACVLCLGLLAGGAVWKISTNSVHTSAQPTDTVLLPVIMYHHLSENGQKLGDYTISPVQFESDLKELQSRGYTAISMQQLRDYYAGKSDLPEKSVLLTFDDGYYSVYTYAYPLLKQYHMPAVCFILGYYTQLYSDGEKQDVNYAHMTWQQLKEMKESGLIELGSHTYNLHKAKGKGERYGISINTGETEKHYCDAILQDLTTLSNAMEQNLGYRPDCFAYPFGAICKQSYPLLHQMGFRFAFTCEEKVNYLCPTENLSDPIRLGRFNRASKYSSKDFMSRMKIK